MNSGTRQRAPILRIMGRRLELVAEVDVDVDSLGVVAPAERTAKGTEDAVVGVADLGTPDGLAVKDVFQLIVLLGDMSIDHDVVLLEQALLQLETSHNQILFHDMAASKTREGQLLVIIDAATVTAQHVHGCRGNVLAEQQAAIDHRLQVGRRGQREGHAPAGAHLAESGVAFPLGEVVGVVGIACLGAHSRVGEVPVVLAVVLGVGVVIEVVIVGLEVADAVRIGHIIIVVVMLPGNAQVNI